MLRFNLSLDDIGNCEETTAFVKKVFLNLAFELGLSFGKFKEPDKFNTSETCKSARKASKTQSGNKFEIVLMMQKCARIFLTFGLGFSGKCNKRLMKKKVGTTFIKTF